MMADPDSNGTDEDAVRRKIGTRLIGGFLASAAITALVGAVGIFALGNMDKNAQHIISVNVEELKLGDRIVADLAVARQYEKEFFLFSETGNTAKQEEYSERLDNAWETLAQDAEAFQHLPLESETRANHADELAGLVSQSRQEMRIVNDSMLAGTSYEEAQPQYLKYKSTVDKLEGVIGHISEHTSDILIESQEQMVQAHALLRNMMIATVMVAPLLALLLGSILTRSVIGPIRKLSDFANNFSMANLTQRVKITSKDEIGELATAFNQMADRLQKSRDEIQQKTQILTEQQKHLEQAVLERTVHLRATNERLEKEITERQQADEMFRALSSSSPVGIYIVQEGRFQYVNPQFSRYTGYSEDELLGMESLRLVHPEDTDVVRENAVKMLKGERSTPYEYRTVNKAGETRWVLETIASIQYQGRRAVLGNYLDITERKRAEEELRRSSEFLRTVLNSANDAISVIDVHDYSIVAANHVFLEHLGLKEEQVVGRKCYEVTHHRSDPCKPPDDTCPLVDTVSTGEHSVAEHIHFRGDNEKVYVEVSTSPIRDAGGNIVQVIHIARNITERKRAEEQIRWERYRSDLILQSAGEGIGEVGLDGRITFMNQAGAQLVGWSKEELIGEPEHAVLHHSRPDGTSYPAEECPIYATIRDGNTHQAADEVLWRKDGSAFPVEYMSTPIRDEHGELAGAVVTFQDITERRAAEKMKDEFISTVSHELRTPLTSVRGSLGLLSSGLVRSSPEKSQRLLEIAVESTDRLIRLINDILDFERMRSGRIEMKQEACDAASLMAHVDEIMQPVAQEAGVRLSVSPQSARLWADPDRVIQILTNLLGNAIKFSPRGATVWLTAEQQGNHMLFKVADQGSGIPADKLETIFERFQQVDGSRSRGKGGTGLGLAICRSIVERHGGHIWVESTLGKGSTFFFTIPTIQEAISATSAPEPGEPTVLVCDDDPSFLEVVSALLESGGYRATTALSGPEAVEQAVALRPAVVLMDIIMPGMSGWETLAALKEHPETTDIPIIIVSCLQREGETDPIQVVEWLSKPVDETALFRALRRALTGEKRAPRLLVVEDDEDLAKVLTAQFQRHGIETFSAGTGSEAIQLAQDVLPDLLILDLILPERDGFAVVDWLRMHDRLGQIPLVVYTAKSITKSERKRLKLGKTLFMTKGHVTPEEFQQRVIGLLNRVVPVKGPDIDD
jgi:PAS domain S-box-containing protein